MGRMVFLMAGTGEAEEGSLPGHAEKVAEYIQPECGSNRVYRL